MLYGAVCPHWTPFTDQFLLVNGIRWKVLAVIQLLALSSPCMTVAHDTIKLPREQNFLAITVMIIWEWTYPVYLNKSEQNVNEMHPHCDVVI